MLSGTSTVQWNEGKSGAFLGDVALYCGVTTPTTCVRA